MRLKRLSSYFAHTESICRKEENLTYEIETTKNPTKSVTEPIVGKKRISPMRLKQSTRCAGREIILSRKEENLTYEIEIMAGFTL